MSRDETLLVEAGGSQAGAGSSVRDNAVMSFTDFVAIAFSTFFGAAVAFLADRLTRARDSRLDEEAALNNLILDLAAKRAFAVSDDWSWAQDEMSRIVKSVEHSRNLVREARLRLRPRSKALPFLRQIVKACNAFLERSERDSDDDLKKSLTILTAAVTREVDALHAQNPRRILSDAPGSASLPDTA
ncbi:MAG TPA: hypothetical protein VGM94_09350 [Galbitalea sp.]